MRCQHCKINPATVDYIEEVNGKKFEFHLCSECYSELYGNLNSMLTSDLWTGLFSASSPRKKSCPICGTTYLDYERTGLLGCTSCYDTFKDELLVSIRKIQGGDTHIGKKGLGDEYGLHYQLKNLQEEMEKALRERRYGDAGKLNKKISAIKKSLNGED